MQVDVFKGHNVRTDIQNGNLIFALADVCAVLGDANPSNVVKRIRERDLHKVEATDALGRKQLAWFVNERGLIRVLQTSRSPLVESFQDWADERVEQLLQGKTVNAAGTVPQSEDALILDAMKILSTRVEKLQLENAALKPKAEEWDTFLGARGSFDVRHSAQLLTRAGIEIGQARLFNKLDELKWTSKRWGKRHAMQRVIEQGLIELKATGYTHPKTGEYIAKDPQIRITPKGLHKLRELLLPPMDVELFNNNAA